MVVIWRLQDMRRLGATEWFFFFQAEDGIRDYKVTGVQTCALPIFAVAQAGHIGGQAAVAEDGEETADRDGDAAQERGGSLGIHGLLLARGPCRADRRDRKSVVEGKRVDLGGRRIIKKKKKPPVVWS